MEMTSQPTKLVQSDVNEIIEVLFAYKFFVLLINFFLNFIKEMKYVFTCFLALMKTSVRLELRLVF
jgi:hypothetical protein